MRRLTAAIRKEFLQFLRDRMLMLLILFIYTADVVMCTYALSFDVSNLKVALYDQDRTQLSGRLIERFSATDYFGEIVPAASPRDVDRLLDAGRADLALVIPPGFARDVAAGRAGVQVLLSGVNSNTANAARGYAQQIVDGFARDVLMDYAARRGIVVELPGVTAKMRIWYNPQLEFRHFMAISMIVVAGLMVGIITAAAGLVREKESGTIEQLIVTPLRSHELVLAKAAPPFAVGMLALGPSLIIGKWLFGVPTAGSLLLFAVASAIALVTFLSVGFFIGTLARNLQQALLLSFFLLFPLMFLSGTVVPVESMPLAMQYLSYASPVRYYMDIALGILLKGVGLQILWPQLLVLAVMGIILSFLAVARLRRHLYA